MSEFIKIENGCFPDGITMEDWPIKPEFQLVSQKHNRMVIGISKCEIDALMEWHRDEQYKCSDREEYIDADWHRNRVELLNRFLEENK